MIELLRRLSVLFVLAILISACSVVNPKPQPPTPPPPPPEPQCIEGQACGCWHHPPEALGWLYACCQPGVPGGVVNVQDPAQCIVTPPPVEPPVPPVEPPVPPTPGVGCVLAGEEVTPSTQTNTTGPDVNAAMHRLVPRCDIGSDCVINEYTQQSWFAAVGAELRKAGLCAGAGGDEMQVALLRSNPWQNFHVFAGDDSSTLPAPPGARRTVNWSPNSWRGAWVSPGGTAPPVEPPVPPVTPPTGESCPFLPCPQRLWTAETLPPGWGPDQIGKPAYKINSHTHTMGNIDSTAVTTRQEPFCASIGMSPMADGTLRAECPVRPDEHPERLPVENWLMFGGPTRDSRMGQNCTPNNTDNAWAFLGGTGNCRMCNVPKTACTPWY